MQVSRSLYPIRLAALLALLIMSVACNKFKELDVTSCEVASLTPKGFRSVDAVLSVGVHNPTLAFTLSDIAGSIRNGDLTIATFTGGPVTVAKKSDGVYNLPCTLMLEEGLSLFEIINLIKTMNFGGYTVDVSGEVSLTNGLKKKLSYEDIPLESLLDKSSLRESLKL
ncbi:MAG: hypothetical protein IJ654_09025 [Bacteroidales bacterium]|nr:hypothetical protein [Bacteroidales bacterium]